MIVSLIIITLALYWLLHETKYLTIHLVSGKDKPIENIEPTPEPESVKPSEHQETVFIELDMPMTSGNVYIQNFEIIES